MPRRALTVAAVVLALLLAPAARAARPTLAVVPFQGPQAKKAEGAVVRALRKRATIIPSTTWTRSARKLFSTTHSSEDIAAVADDVGAQVVVTGLVKKDGRHYELSVSIRDGKTGKTKERLKYPLSSARISSATLATLTKEIGPAFDAALAGGAGTGVDKTPAEETPPATPEKAPPPVAAAPTPPPPPARAEREEAPPPPPKKRNAGPAERLEAEPPPPPPPPTAEATPPPPPPATDKGKRPRWAPYFDLTAGFSISGRSFDFDPNSQPRFASGIVPGVYGELTLNPLAFTWNKAAGVVSGLGVHAMIHKPFWPDSSSKQDPNQRYKTDELKFEGGLRWRIVLYKPMPRPQLILDAAYGFHSFSLGKDAGGQDVGPADVAYKYLSFGGGIRIHFAEWMYLWAMFHYHAVLDAGPIVDVNTEYGPANVFGLRVSGGLDFFLYKGLKLGAEAYYERFQLQFTPGNLMPAKAANSGTDQYFGGVIVVGYVL
jgi:TolB-like protein